MEQSSYAFSPCAEPDPELTPTEPAVPDPNDLLRCPECTTPNIEPADPPPPPPDVAPPRMQPGQQSGAFARPRGDPVAQSFVLPEDMFVTSIDIFVATVDIIERDFWVSIRDMKNGFPVADNIAIKNLRTEDVITSDDGSVPFKVTFDYPVFCTAGKEYCFVVGGWSPNTRIWMSRVGDKLINDQTKTVDTQPTLGSSFRSQNGETWNAEQFEDIKYTIRVAKFKTNTLDITLNQENSREIMIEDPFECQVGFDSIRVYHESHGLNAGDKFIVSMFESSSMVLKTDSGKAPTIGQNVYSGTGYGVIESISTVTGGYRVSMKNVTGYFKTNDVFTCDTLDLLDRSGDKYLSVDRITGTIQEANITVLAGIPVSELVGEHSVFLADTPHTFIFKINPATPPSSTGRFGGKNVIIESNAKYEVFNASASYMLYGSTEDWSLRGIGHNTPGGVFTASDYQEQPPVKFTPGEDVHLGRPYKLANNINESISVKSGKSIAIKAVMISKSQYVSPVINLNTFSTLLISNHVGKASSDLMDVAPNAAARYIDETSVHGSESYKYVTRAITLQKPASDLMVAFDVYKDKDADFDVFYKVVYSNQNTDIEDVEWTQLPVETKRDSADLDDRVEYELLASDVIPTWSGKEYSRFKIKLVGTAMNSAKPPLFKNFRAIAVT